MNSSWSGSLVFAVLFIAGLLLIGAPAEAQQAIIPSAVDAGPVIAQPGAMVLGPVAARQIAYRARDGRYLIASKGGVEWTSLTDQPMSQYRLSHCQEDVYLRELFPYPLDLSGCEHVAYPERFRIERSIIRLKLEPYVLTLGPVPRALVPPVNPPPVIAPHISNPAFVLPTVVNPRIAALLPPAGVVVPRVLFNPGAGLLRPPSGTSLSTTGRAGTVVITHGTAYTFGAGIIAPQAVLQPHVIAPAPVVGSTHTAAVSLPSIPAMQPGAIHLTVPGVAPVNGPAAPLAGPPAAGGVPVLPQPAGVVLPRIVVPSSALSPVHTASIVVPPVVGRAVVPGMAPVNGPATPLVAPPAAGGAPLLPRPFGVVLPHVVVPSPVLSPVHAVSIVVPSAGSSQSVVGHLPAPGITAPPSPASVLAASPVVPTRPVITVPGTSLSTTGRAGTVVITHGTAYTFGPGIIALTLAAPHTPAPPVGGGSASVGGVPAITPGVLVAPVIWHANVGLAVAPVSLPPITSGLSLASIATPTLTKPTAFVPPGGVTGGDVGGHAAFGVRPANIAMPMTLSALNAATNYAGVGTAPTRVTTFGMRH